MFELHYSDCLAFMRTLPDNHIDAIVTDPPYELGFMGKSWDRSGIANSVEMWTEALRVLKPGGHLLAFSGSRTYHRMTCAIEDAGFEVRDQIMWLYGSGFPKSHDVSKAIDREAGAAREVVGHQDYSTPDIRGAAYDQPHISDRARLVVKITVPATDAAKQWHGWGTALKPAHEPICVARKPLMGTVAENVLTWGTGGVNVDGCRVGFVSDADKAESMSKNQHADFGTLPMTNNNVYGDYSMVQPANYNPTGRWPANVIHDGSDEVVELFPGNVKGGTWNRTAGARHFNNNGDHTGYQTSGSDASTGSAARFFYCAKASKRDRDEGCEGNIHNTVKPTDLMRYLCRLVTPPNGLVFDPFTGSGSTGKAAILEGFRFIGCDMTAEYIDIARARIEHAMKQTAPVPIVPPDEDPAQMTLF